MVIAITSIHYHIITASSINDTDDIAINIKNGRFTLMPM